LPGLGLGRPFPGQSMPPVSVRDTGMSLAAEGDGGGDKKWSNECAAYDLEAKVVAPAGLGIARDMSKGCRR